MAVFMTNICTFNGCGIIFPSLVDLIWHIEDVHIDYDPAVIEQKEASQPTSVPLSYIKRFLSEAARRQLQNTPPVADVRRRLSSAPKTPSVRSSTPTGSEIDEDEHELMSPSEDSNDSWTTVEEYSSDFILRYGVKMNANATSGALGPAAQEKPFACPVPGCKKRYKNVNGIKYHSKNGHKKDGKKFPVLPSPYQYRQKVSGPKKRLSAQEYFWRKWVHNFGIKKAYKCQCGKSYKTAQGLKSHSISQHMTSPATPSIPSPETGRGVAPKMPGLVVTSSPANHGRSLNIIDGIDANKLVRIYDSIKTKDLPSFTIPKHNLTNLNIISANQNTVRHSVLLTPTSTPGCSPKGERAPKLTVSTHPGAYAHEHLTN